VEHFPAVRRGCGLRYWPLARSETCQLRIVVILIFLTHESRAEKGTSDRRFDRKLDEKLKRMRPQDVDALFRGGED
jgi:hypothetical protein